MALPRVGVSIGITLNVGNYESIRAEALFQRDATPAEDPYNVYTDCMNEAGKGLLQALDGVKEILDKVKGKTVDAAPAKAVGPARPRR